MPQEVENLIEITRIKNMARAKKINKIAQKENSIVFYFLGEEFNMDSVSKLIEKYKNNIRFSPSALPYVTYKIDLDKSVFSQIKEFLEII